MSYIYINEQGSEISVDGGYCVIDTPDKAHKKIPIETIEYVSLFGNIHITTPAIQMFMQNKIPVTLYSNRGALWQQTAMLAKAIDCEDYTIYKPIQIR